jgi:predicted DNA-binding transcriptional regulator AlpA
MNSPANAAAAQSAELIVRPLMTTEQAAAYLGWGVSTLEQSRVSGINCPQFVKMGRSVRYRLADLEAYVASRIRTSTAHAA